jgi:methyltransferase (TIGR00027 family)
MKETAADTGQGPTGVVAMEQYLPEKKRVINDDLARRILPLVSRTYLWFMRFKGFRNWTIRYSEKNFPGIWAMALCRKRYIEDKAVESLKVHIEAVLNLGAGLDTLAYRAPSLANVMSYEVDLPTNTEIKRKRLTRVLGKIPSHVTLVPMDFDQQDIMTELASHGYSIDRRSFFILEGVTQYLAEAGVRQTFDFLSKAAPGSRMVFTYVCKEFLEGKNLYDSGNLYTKYVRKDKIWKFGIDPDRISSFTDKYGWRVLEHVGYRDLVEQYVKPTGRCLASIPIERLVYAEKT